MLVGTLRDFAMTFQLLVLITAAAALLLGVGWVFAGTVMLKRWGHEPNEVALVIGRRLGIVYLSIAMFCLIVRDTQSGELIHVFSTFGMIVNAGLATMGSYELLKRRVGKAMLVSIIVEILLVAAYGRFVMGAIA
jgi:hypothetical protein